MEQKKLGKFQIEIGWVLVIVTIFVGVFGYYLILNRLTVTFSGLTKSWSDLAANKSLSPEFIGHIMGYVNLLSSMYFIGIILFAVLLLLLLSVAIILITQGTSNANLAKTMKKEELNLAEAKRKFRNAFALSFSVILIGSLLFFKPNYGHISATEYGIVFGFPSEYTSYSNGLITNFSFYGFWMNLVFSLLVSYGISWIYYRFILGTK